MKKIKEEKGITLVALIITIVVLLILAAVAIGTVKNSDIIGHAQNAAGSFNQAKANEVDLLAQYEKEIEDNLPKQEEPIWGEVTVDGETTLCYIGKEKDLKVINSAIRVQELIFDFNTNQYTKVDGAIKNTTFSEYDMIVFITAPYIETIDFGDTLSSNIDVRGIDCTNLREVKGLGGVTAITNDSFACCTSLEYIEIPTTVTTIESSAFYECTNLTKITIPSNVTSIGKTAFKNLTEVTINKTKDEVEAEGGIGTEWIPESVTKIIYSDQTIDLTKNNT